jgi:peptidoglycan/LPS O-acetylase OafA/YrhL
MEPLKAVLGVSLGTLSVYLFFAVSGFLIARSYDRSASLADWFTSRCLRLFPALFVVLLLTVLLLGPARVCGPWASVRKSSEFSGCYERCRDGVCLRDRAPVGGSVGGEDRLRR